MFPFAPTFGFVHPEDVFDTPFYQASGSVLEPHVEFSVGSGKYPDDGDDAPFHEHIHDAFATVEAIRLQGGPSTVVEQGDPPDTHRRCSVDVFGEVRVGVPGHWRPVKSEAGTI